MCELALLRSDLGLLSTGHSISLVGERVPELPPQRWTCLWSPVKTQVLGPRSRQPWGLPTVTASGQASPLLAPSSWGSGGGYSMTLWGLPHTGHLLTQKIIANVC